MNALLVKRKNPNQNSQNSQQVKKIIKLSDLQTSQPYVLNVIKRQPAAPSRTVQVQNPTNHLQGNSIQLFNVFVREVVLYSQAHVFKDIKDLIGKQNFATMSKQDFQDFFEEVNEKQKSIYDTRAQNLCAVLHCTNPSDKKNVSGFCIGCYAEQQVLQNRYKTKNNFNNDLAVVLRLKTLLTTYDSTGFQHVKCLTFSNNIFNNCIYTMDQIKQNK